MPLSKCGRKNVVDSFADGRMYVNPLAQLQILIARDDNLSEDLLALADWVSTMSVKKEETGGAHPTRAAIIKKFKHSAAYAYVVNFLSRRFPARK